MLGQNVRLCVPGYARLPEHRKPSETAGLAARGRLAGGIQGARPLDRAAFLSGHPRRANPAHEELSPAHDAPAPAFFNHPPRFSTVPRLWTLTVTPVRRRCARIAVPRKCQSHLRSDDVPGPVSSVPRPKNASPRRRDSRPCAFFDDPAPWRRSVRKVGHPRARRRVPRHFSLTATKGRCSRAQKRLPLAQ